MFFSIYLAIFCRQVNIPVAGVFPCSELFVCALQKVGRCDFVTPLLIPHKLMSSFQMSTRNRKPSAADAAKTLNSDDIDLLNNAANKTAPIPQVTPEKRTASDQPPNRPKKPREVKNKYYWFKMAGDMEDAFLEGVPAANAHREDYGGLALEERGFHLKKDFVAFRKELENAKSVPGVAAAPARAVSNPSAIAQAVLAKMNNDRACDRFQGYFKTTGNSKMAVMIIRAINQFDSDAWVFKPEFLAEIFRNLGEIAPHPDLVVREALLNFSFGKASDPDKVDKNMVLQAMFNPSDNPTKTMTLDVFRAYTFFTIPVDDIDNKTDEGKWLHDAATRILRGIQQTMISDVFKETLECIASSRRTAYIGKLYRKDMKSNLPRFCNGAVVRADPIVRLTDHVIQTVCNDMMSHLYQNRVQGYKYPVVLNDEEEEEQEENESEK